MLNYNFKAIENKWQKFWDETNTFAAKNDFKNPKFYALIEFPYPSGEGLHVGHLRSYTAIDIIARKRRMQKYNVLYPIGWDAFGLPTENFAIKNKMHPKDVNQKNIRNFKKQLKSLGFSFDWTREINTTDPEYYKWTQWIFLQLFNRGLAYKAEVAVNWCVSCKCVLANEEVIDGKCERCDSNVIHKNKSQWVLKITEYAQRLIDDLENADFPERVKLQQINWIGRSEGAEINFNTNVNQILRIFTTRPETIFGVTYMTIAPEHSLLNEFRDGIQNISEIDSYKSNANKKSDLERTELSKEKIGIEIKGIYAVNPISGEKIPIFVSDYVLMTYGTGAIMAVPAHDERDMEFAEKYNLKTKLVIDDEKNTMINSDFLNGLAVNQAKSKIISYIEKNNLGCSKINYKLRDWIFSRQRYWGEPIPIIICEKCGLVLLEENDLPLRLPNIKCYETSEIGESPLVNIADWVNVKCPKCKGAAKRETDTMPQWAGSSWYFLRYADCNNNNTLANREMLDYWLPVDWYNGGMEHTTLHLLYSRFWHKFLYDIGVVSCCEPYKKRTSHGVILGENGEKMSKSRRNVVNPDEIVEEYGADAIRLYEMFIGDFEQSAPWNIHGIKGCKRFLNRFWDLQQIILKNSTGIRKNFENILHKTIKKVSEDIEKMNFNTAIAAMMSLINEIYNIGSITKEELKIFSILLNPFAPHITEEIWRLQNLGSHTVFEQNWPIYDIDKCFDETFELVLQINGKIKDKVIVSCEVSESDAVKLALKNEKILKSLNGGKIKKTIYVPKKLVNVVI